MPHPPLAALLLLRLLLSKSHYQAIAGDLAEDYTAHIQPRLGTRRANRWFWRNTLSALTARLVTPAQFTSDPERTTPMAGLLQDLRYAARTLRQSPGFAVTAILALALGIGVNTAIFTIFDQMAFRPLPVKNGDRLVGVYETFRGSFSRSMHGNIHMLSYPELLNYQAQNQVFTGMAAEVLLRTLTLAGAQPEPVSGVLVSKDYFRVLEASTTAGRTFLPEECESPHAVAVLNNGFWRRRFGADPAIIGSTIRLDRTLFTVVGVTAPDFVGTQPKIPDLWLPLSMQPVLMPDPNVRDFMSAENLSWLSVVGRLKPGVTPRQAQAALAVLAAQRDTLYPGRITQVEITPGAFLMNPSARSAGLLAGAMVLAAVGLVLLIACANIANLLLARAAGRRREIAVRLSMGATRARLIRQLLTESIVIAAAGGGLGLLVAQWSLRAGFTFLQSRTSVSPVSPNLDLNVLLYTVLLSVAANVMFGLVPALHATNPNLSASLKDEGARLGQRVSRIRLRNELISCQVAVCMVLLVAAGLLVRGLMNVHSLNPGFRLQDVFLTSVDLRLQRYDDARAASFYRQLLARLDAEPGVQSALAAHAPLRGVAITAVSLEGQSADHMQEANFNTVSANYFDVMGIGLLRGRTFTAAEMDRGDNVAVVSDAMAQVYWRGRDPIGQYFLYRPGGSAAMRSAQIIGVAKDIRGNHISEPDGPSFYLPVNPAKPLDLSIVTHVSGPTRLTGTIRQLVRDLDPSVLASIATMEDNLEHETSPARVGMALALTLGALALLLATVGIYGVMTYAVSQRTHEIGIRMTLGAERSAVLRLMLSESMRPVLLGIAIGAALSAAAASALSKLLLGISPFDPLAFAFVAVLLSGVALLASYIPARRATRVDPVVALRYE